MIKGRSLVTKSKWMTNTFLFINIKIVHNRPYINLAQQHHQKHMGIIHTYFGCSFLFRIHFFLIRCKWIGVLILFDSSNQVYTLCYECRKMYIIKYIDRYWGKFALHICFNVECMMKVFPEPEVLLKIVPQTRWFEKYLRCNLYSKYSIFQLEVSSSKI